MSSPATSASKWAPGTESSARPVPGRVKPRRLPQHGRRGLEPLADPQRQVMPDRTAMNPLVRVAVAAIRFGDVCARLNRGLRGAARLPQPVRGSPRTTRLTVLARTPALTGHGSLCLLPPPGEHHGDERRTHERANGLASRHAPGSQTFGQVVEWFGHTAPPASPRACRPRSNVPTLSLRRESHICNNNGANSWPGKLRDMARRKGRRALTVFVSERERVLSGMVGSPAGRARRCAADSSEPAFGW